MAPRHIPYHFQLVQAQNKFMLHLKCLENYSLWLELEQDLSAKCYWQALKP